MHQWWNDGQFNADLDKRSADLKNGKDKGVTWDALKKKLLNPNKKVSKSKSDH